METDILLSEKAQKKGKLIKWILIPLISLVGLLIITVFIFAVGIYKYHWDNPPTKIVLKYFPYPAALVNYQLIPISEVQKELIHRKTFYQQMKQSYNETEEKTRILDFLIEEKLIQQEAKKLKIAISKDELDAYYNQLVVNFGDEGKLEKGLSQLFGYSIEEFKEKRLKNVLLRNKVKEEVETKVKVAQIFLKIPPKASSNTEKQIKQKMILILEQLKKGADFGDLAKKYSQDKQTKDKGGEMGFIRKGETESNFEKVAFTLKIGEISGIIKTSTGFHIIKVLDKKGEDFEKWLEELKKRSKIIKLI